MPNLRHLVYDVAWLQPDTRVFCALEVVIKCCCHCTGLIAI